MCRSDARGGAKCRLERVGRVAALNNGKDDRHVDAGLAVRRARVGDGLFITDDADGIEHGVRHGCDGGGTVPGGVRFARCCHFLAEAGAREAWGVRVDDDVGEQVETALWRGELPVSYPDVHVGVDRRVPSGADLRDAPGHVARRGGS